MVKDFLKRFNIIDYVLFGILVLSLTGVVVRITVGAGGGERVPYHITFVCEDAPDEILKRAPNGGTCEDAQNSVNLGQITSVQRGEPPMALKFVTELKGSASSYGILTGGKQYVIGQYLTVNMGSVQLPVYITDISERQRAGSDEKA